MSLFYALREFPSAARDDRADEGQPGNGRATLTAMPVGPESVLPVRVPTLVIHATDDLVPVQPGRYLAARSPAPGWSKYPGRDHAPWLYEGDLANEPSRSS